MKKFKYILVGLCAAVLAAAPVAAKQKSKKMDKKDAGQMMSPECIAYMTPGEGQKKLEAFVGNWNYTVKMWMSPDAPAMEMKGVGENKMIFGGRHLQETAKGEPDPNMGGQAFEGQGTISFDNMKKEYTSTWTDNMASGAMVTTGKYSADGQTLEATGAMPDPMSGQANKPFRTTTRWIDPDTYVYEMFAAGKDGKEFRTMEITYKRVK